MATINHPAQSVTTCDVCGKEIPRTYGSHLHVARTAHDFQGGPVADASVHRDLCEQHTDVVVKAINDAILGKGRSIPHNAVCFYPDGNKTCAVFGDFINLQESPAGFGDNFEEALANLKADAAKESK